MHTHTHIRTNLTPTSAAYLLLALPAAQAALSEKKVCHSEETGSRVSRGTRSAALKRGRQQHSLLTFCLPYTHTHTHTQSPLYKCACTRTHMEMQEQAITHTPTHSHVCTYIFFVLIIIMSTHTHTYAVLVCVCV